MHERVATVVLTYKVLSTQEPAYLYNLIHVPCMILADRTAVMPH